MNSILKSMKNELDGWSDDIKGIKAQIRQLKWKDDDSADNYFKLRARPQNKEEMQDAKHLAELKRSYRKEMLRSDTGEERSELWGSIRDCRCEVRHLTLAYGFLRGLPYYKMERSCNTPPDPELILSIMQDFADKNDETLDDWTVEKLRTLIFEDTALRKKIREKLKMKGADDLEFQTELIFNKINNKLNKNDSITSNKKA